VNLESFTGL